MRELALGCVAVGLLSACGNERGALAIRPDSAALVTTLGHDTLAVERLVSLPGRVEVEVLLRTPTTTYRTYVLERGLNGNTRRVTAEVRPADDWGGEPTTRQVFEFGEDSVTVSTTENGATTTSVVPLLEDALPVHDMMHWPFDVALRGFWPSGADSVQVPLLTEASYSEFTLRRGGEGGASITDPSRGTMDVAVDDEGRLLSLSAAATTRKLEVARADWADLQALSERFVSEDEAGRGIGTLSSQRTDHASFGGADITVEHGAPLKRGREIWGALVPYGEVWRTGANTATSFVTSADLLVGDLEVPAGAYSLFTIPDRAGSTLIFNRETGQPGTAYDPAQDLGRTLLAHRVLRDPVEEFAVLVEGRGTRGELRLRWDRLELVVPIQTR